MKSIIYCDNFYNDPESLYMLLSGMEFEDGPFGQEIQNFNYIPAGLDSFFCQVLTESVAIQPDTGIFRKPNTLVHFEPFYQHSLWVCVVALEDTVIELKQQEGVKTFFDVQNMDEFIADNTNNPEKWTTSASINIPKNSFVFIRPWLWYQLEADKLVQIFMLNHSEEGKNSG